MAVWHTVRPDSDDRRGYGRLGRAMDPGAGRLVAVGGGVPASLRGRRSTADAFDRLDEALLADPRATRLGVGTEPTDDDLLGFVRRQAVDAQATAARLAALGRDNGGAGYPQSALADRLKLVGRLLKADAGTRVFYLRQTGYDIHARQPDRHADLLAEFAGAVAAFVPDLTAAKLADRVTILASSEFGRTVRENGSAGTDHGTAGAVFVAGPTVRGGVVGTMPSLTDLEGGEPKMTTDFRAVYAAILRDWMGLPADAGVPELGRVPLFRG